MSYIPGKINNFNLYQGTASESSKLLGVTAEVTLPNFQYVSETLNMAGMAGEIDDPSAGQLQSSTIEIPFSNISRENIDLARNDQIPLIMRAAQEMINKDTGAKEYKGRVITVKGMTKAINYGSLQKNGYGNPSITKEVTYYKEEIDGEVITEIDKINGICKINDTDVVDNISNLI